MRRGPQPAPGSSHIILAYTNQREFVTLGAAFTQRLFRNHIWALDYQAEIRPPMVESDPVFTGAYYNINLPPYGGYPGMQASADCQSTATRHREAASHVNLFTHERPSTSGRFL